MNTTLMVTDAEAYKSQENELAKYKSMHLSAEGEKRRMQQIIDDQSIRILTLENLVLRGVEDMQDHCAVFEQMFETNAANVRYESCAEYLLRAEYLAAKKLRDCNHFIVHVRQVMNSKPSY